VLVKTATERVDTGRRKFGVLIADEAEAGCNAVLQPGTILGKHSAVLPTISFAGYLPPNTLAAARVEIRHLPRPD